MDVRFLISCLTRSEAAVFSDQTLEDDDSPVIRGFSDDEPLVIAWIPSCKKKKRKNAFYSIFVSLTTHSIQSIDDGRDPWSNFLARFSFIFFDLFPISWPKQQFLFSTIVRAREQMGMWRIAFKP